MSRVTEEEVFAVLRRSIASVWALELLLLLRRTDARVWTYDELVLELRSSRTAVEHASASLISSGLLAEQACGLTYRPASYELRRFGDELQRIYSARPVSVMKAIMTAPE